MQACRDGNCRIVVAGPVTIVLDGTYPAEVSITPQGDRAEYHAASGAGTSVGGSIGVGCSAVPSAAASGSGGSSRSIAWCGTAPPPAATQGVVLRVPDARDGAVVVDIGTT
ncbi:hypothetical protein [Embleya hyalina]|uniref:hypothetical protein n=1 Tax=Embleya hyalina TaxID=516124 RepID=UPI000F845560|nr:hypothetical protein [Embleya hyalina]